MVIHYASVLALYNFLP